MRSNRVGCAAAAALAFLLGGCAIGPSKTTTNLNAPAAIERDLLIEAAGAVDYAPWPKPEPVSIVSRITGGGGDRVTRSDAVEAYIAGLAPAGAKFSSLASDADANLDAAARLNQVAQNTLSAPRLSVHDVVVVEDAIKALRDNRQIYLTAARELKNHDEPVDSDRLQAIRDRYARAIKDLGQTADMLAERVDDNRSQTYAGPDRSIKRNFSGASS